MPTTPLQRRLFIGTTICGLSATLLVMMLEIVGALEPLERWMYDRRAKDCQYFQPAPSDQIVHLDIDDESLEAVGRWPWRRRVMADILDELQVAGPKAVALDVLLSEPETIEAKLPSGELLKIDEDVQLVDSIRRLESTILAISFMLKVPVTPSEAWQEQTVVELTGDILLSPEALAARIHRSGTDEKLVDRVRADYPELRRRALHEILTTRMRTGPVDLDQITDELNEAPTTATARTARVQSPLSRMIASQYRKVSAEREAHRVALRTRPDLAIQPADVWFNLVPFPALSHAMSGAGFVDHDIFSEAVIRSVPLFVRRDQDFYPQFGLAFACRMLDADVTRATLTNDAVILPTPKGELRIPVRPVFSPAFRREVGAIMDVPWFGTTDWKTMYDYPKHQTIARHFSVNAVWDVVRARQKVADNHREFDQAVLPLLENMSQSKKAAYVSLNLSPDDFERRRQFAPQLLEDVSASAFEEAYRDTPDSGLQPDEVVLRKAIAVIRRTLFENDALAKQIVDGRARLKQHFGGKGVFIGWVATGAADTVTTPLHARCPGVVVHSAIANAILTGHFKRTAPHWMVLVITILFGAGATFVTSRLHPPSAIGAVAVMALTYFVINGIALYDKLDVIVGVAAPLVAVVLCWGSCTAFRLIVEGIERLRLSKEAAALDHEISLARRIQAALIPKVMRPLPEIDSHGWTMAASTTGGDCFDLWKLSDGRLGILVADASGHGLGPSMIVSQTRALVRALCDLYPDPQKLLDRINARMAVDLDGSKFCTTFVGYMDTAGRIEWGSAGHGPMLWCSCQTGELLELDGTGLPLGVSDDWFGEESVPPLLLDEGGTLVVISDGIFEAPNPKGEQFDVQRVKDILHHHCQDCPEQLIERLRAAVRDWQGNDEPHDDQTIVIVRRAKEDKCPAEAIA